MIHHERLRPPAHDYPADEWNIIEKGVVSLQPAANSHHLKTGYNTLISALA